uniref:DNA ligase n=1 Tax=Paenibacillus xylanivorans TaxID=1705561 RepID=UPI000A85E819|nr:DNA ligase [Paenibacillus xylanivorans]
MKGLNISSVIRGLLGDSKPGNAKPLELKEGQVVRGSVVSVSDDGADAVLQIQGVQVRAKLETPLRPGETTLLQVQPPGENGVTVMKPLTGALAELPQASLNNLLQEVGLPDTKGNRELLLAMQRSGLPLTKDNVAMVQNMMTAKPAQVPAEEWVQATGIAFQRGLPVTAETVKGLHQAVFGPPLHQLLKGLAEQLESMLTQTAGKTLPTGEQAATVKPTVMGGMTVPLSGEQTGVTVAASGGGRVTGGTSGLAGQLMPGAPAGAAPVADGSQDNAGNAVKGNGQTGTSTGTGTGSAEATGVKSGASNIETAGKVGAGIPAGTGIPGESPRTADVGVAGSRPGTPGAAVDAAAGRVIAGQPDGRSETPAAAGPSAAAGQVAPAAPSAAQLAPKLLALLDALRSASTAAPAQPGAATQAAPASQGGQAAAAAGGVPQPLPAGADALPAGGSAAAPAGAAAAPLTHEGDPWVGRVLKLLGAEHEQQAVHGAAAQARVGEVASPGTADSLKGLLLQLASSDGAPAALKDAAGQAVQFLTGQQLLLTTDRSAAFAQMHWFIPITGPDGEETASVQIQSRRGQRGELDASNCRLWFDLDMKSLGPTLVDVHVVNNIVSLRVLNDREGMGSLLESGREEIHRALDKLGYQLLTFKAEPWPVGQEPGAERKMTASDYSPERYKGVDMRV